MRSIFALMDLSVIIVSYDVKYFLEHCLLSVQKACSGIDAELLVADNASADGSREYLEPKFSNVRFFWNTENVGFAKANNAMLQKASGRYILFLNPDTIVPEDCFTRCIRFFKAHADCGALGVKMIDGSGSFLPESKRTLPNARSGFYKMAGLAAIFPRSKKLAGYYANDLGTNETGPVDILAGAFMMLTADVANRVNGFDENFFMYGEDVDLSYRLLQAGFTNYYLGQTAIIHFKGESTQKNSPAYVRHFYGAMKRFADKHYKKNLLRDITIGFGKNIALLKAGLSRGSKAGNHRNTIFIRGEGTEKIRSALEANNYRILPHGETNAATVIFCEGSLANKMIIEQLKDLPSKTAALFCESGAGSIIGSNNKDKRGFAIAMS